MDKSIFESVLQKPFENTIYHHVNLIIVSKVTFILILKNIKFKRENTLKEIQL